MHFKPKNNQGLEHSRECSPEVLSIGYKPMQICSVGSMPHQTLPGLKAGQQLYMTFKEDTANLLLWQGCALGSSTHQEFLSFQHAL